MAVCLKGTLFALSFALFAGEAEAQTAAAFGGGQLPFQALGPDQGLPSSTVIGMAQDAEGFLWFGTQNGLYRYEGGRTRTWTQKDGLPSGYIQGLLAARGGGVWVSTLHGLLRFKDGRFEPALLGGGASTEGPWGLAEDRHGRLWIAERRGLFVQKEGLRFEALPYRPEGVVLGLACGIASGDMYLASPGRLVAMNEAGGIRQWTAAEGLPAGETLLVAEDAAGRLWAGSGRSLAMKERTAARFADRSRELPASLSPTGTVHVETDGTLWFPTQDGALRIRDGRPEVLDTAKGLPFRWVRTAFRDREGTLWMVGPGAARVLGGERIWNHGLGRTGSSGIVWSILRLRDGRLLIGTDDGAGFLQAKGMVRIPGTEGRRIKCILEDRDGTLWLASTIGPALWWKPGRPKAEIAPLGDSGKGINVVRKDGQGRIWIGHTREGVLRWDAASRRLVPEAGPAIAGSGILNVFEVRLDAQERVWAATSAGLLVREPDGRWKRFGGADGLLPHALLGLGLLADGSAWVFYQEPSGLVRVRVDQGRLQVLERRTRGDGLSSDAVYAVQEDAHGRAWAATDQGLDRLDQPLHVGRHDGMANEDGSLNALLAEPDRVWVGTAGGLVRFETGGLAPPPPPAARVLQVRFGDRSTEPPFDSFAPVPAKASTAEFRFTALAFRNEPDLRFQVRLEGLEAAWRDSEARLARFPLLPAGHYRFEVRAAQGLGPFGPASAVSFTVLPPWWKTWWAYALEIAALLAAVAAVIRLRLATLARSKAHLERVVARRTEELRARNEDLSTALGKVRQLSGLLPICANCKKIRDDHGYWNQLEHYISEHSEADFSHGVCPDCVPLLYPDLPPREEAPKPER